MDSKPTTPSGDRAGKLVVSGYPWDIHSGRGLIIWGEDGEMLGCNRSAAAILGRPESDLPNMSFDDAKRRKAEAEMAPSPKRSGA